MRDGLENLAKVSNPSFDRRTDCAAAQVRLLWKRSIECRRRSRAGTRLVALYEGRDEASDIVYQAITSMMELMLGQEGRRRGRLR